MFKRLLFTLMISLTTLCIAQRDEYYYEREYEQTQSYFCSEASFWYTKLGGALISMGEETGYGLGIGLGYRFLEGHSGADLSIQWLIGQNARDRATSQWVLPRLCYLYSFSPEQCRGYYIGGGVGYAGTRTHDHRFRGVTIELLLGYDLFRGRRLRQFIELEISQPAIRTCKKEKSLHSPSGTCSFGVGF